MSLSMQLEERTFFRRIDINLIFVVLALNVVGLINLYSATHGVHSTDNRLFFLQLIWLAGGWACFFIATLIDYKVFIRAAYVIYGLNLVALVMVKFVGKAFYGAQRWLDLGFFRYQPSETMKLALVLVLARILPRYISQEGLSLRDLFLPIAFTLPPVLLTAIQPDLGTAILMAAISVSLILFLKVQKNILIAGVVLALVGGGVVWKFGLKEYQRNRVETFLDPGKDPRGAGYNSIQSKIAVGSGRFVGKGFLKGTQSQLEFLPERHTDFIFSVLSEEFGFVGSLSTIILFGFLYYIGISVATRARDSIGVLLCAGALTLIFWHMFVNICMVTGLMPIVGVPLPLLSYGGSGTLTVMLGLGIISSVSYRRYLF